VSRLKLGRRQTIGVLFGLVGIYLIGYVAPNLDPQRRGISFEPPPTDTKVTFDPSTVVTAIGLVFVLCAIGTFFERRSERLARGALLTASLLFVPLVIVVALALSESSETNVMQLLVESLRLSTPVALGAMAGLWCERSGVVNIGIEGMMLMAACTGFIAYVELGDAQDSWALWVGILVAVVTGGLIALLHALLSVSYRVDQIISGVVINLLALGLTGFLRSEVLVDTGINTGVPTAAVGLPLLSEIPIVGPQLFTNKPIFFAMFVVIALTSWVLFHTPFGLRVRSVGEHPHAAETVGIDPIRIRYVAVVIGGLVAGLAGAWFSLESQASGFQDRMTNGAGFIALAALIFGRWRPWTAFAGAILFGFTRALGARLQILQVTIGDFSIPSEFLQALPYVVTIIVVAGAIGKAVPPAADGQPYERSR
jgi:general nucleoside transport system permease protein